MSTLCYKKWIYENLTLKIYIRTVKHYTDIDPAFDFVSPVNKIDRLGFLDESQDHAVW
jgi:hypothetical protein